MLAYVFWHIPFPHVDRREYEAALLGFQSDLAGSPSSGLLSCATYRIGPVPWLGNRPGYEDWYFVPSSAALDRLNEEAVRPERWEIHASVASKMDFGCGGLYRHEHGEAQSLRGARIAWLKRPRGISYREPLRRTADRSAGFLSCWRRQMVLGPADEFAVVGSSELEASVPEGWQAQTVERMLLVPPASI